MKIQLSENETLVLRTSKADGTSRNNFKWPKQGPVKCSDWLPIKDCGNGLHGALMGEGEGHLFNWTKDALWQVVRVNKNEIIDLDGKVKFPKGFVVYSGDRKTATDIIYENGGKAVIGGIQTVGDGQVATAGDYGTATAGYGGIATTGDYGTATTDNRGTAMAGYKGTATVGDYGTAIAGNEGTATTGDRGAATVGEEGTATTGNGGTATAGDRGTAIAGDGGIAMVGYRGIATSGKNGVSIAGHYGKCRAGINGQISIYYWDKKNCRSRTKTGYIGENGLKPNVFYRLDNNANFVKVDV